MSDLFGFTHGECAGLTDASGQPAGHFPGSVAPGEYVFADAFPTGGTLPVAWVEGVVGAGSDCHSGVYGFGGGTGKCHKGQGCKHHG